VCVCVLIYAFKIQNAFASFMLHCLRVSVGYNVPARTLFRRQEETITHWGDAIYVLLYAGTNAPGPSYALLR